jgi:outer membrane protein TolC
VIRKITISNTFLLLFLSGAALFCQDKSDDMIDLDFLIKAALENNPGLLDKQTSVEISEQGIQLNRSAILPQIDVNANTYLSNEYGNTERFLSASTGISVSQMIWQNGRYRALIMQSEYAFMADKWELEAERQELTLQVKLLYYDLLKYRSLYDISLQNVAQAKLFLEAAIEKKELGIGKESDILKARSDLGDAEYLVKSMHYSIINAENGLSRLIGESVSGKNIRTGPDFVLSGNVFLANDSLYSMALNSYPELNAMMNLQLSQDYSVKAEEATRFPVFSANAGYNILSNTQIETQAYEYRVDSKMECI